MNACAQYISLLLSLSLGLSLGLPAYAQEDTAQSCGADKLLKEQLEAAGLTKADFEAWMQEKMDVIPPQIPGVAYQTEGAVYQVPIVFHVLHYGEPLGEGYNIPKERILEQVEITTKSYRRQNENAGIEPEEFRAIAADVGIAFVLAKRDPYGLPTDGIVRVEIPEAERENIDLRAMGPALSKWPEEDYVNIWTYPSADDDPLRGFADFPVLDAIDDLSVSHVDYNRPFGPYGGVFAQDGRPPKPKAGVFLAYNAVGRHTITVEREREGVTVEVTIDVHGSTATHELGHMLGLFHLWEGEECAEPNDYCDDTPFTNGADHVPADQCGRRFSSCGSLDMFNNYMHGSPDVCRSMFSPCQKQRMRTVLVHHPVLSQLLESNGAEPFVTRSLDLGLHEILAPLANSCDNEYRPAVVVVNYGEATIGAYSLDLYVNDVLEQSLSMTEALPRYGIDTLVFQTLSAPVTMSTNTFSFRVRAVDGAADAHAVNNELSITLPVQAIVPLSMAGESFDDPESLNWYMREATREKVVFLDDLDDLAGGKFLKFPFYGDSEDAGQRYILSSPFIDLSTSSEDPIFRFRYSYTADRVQADLLEIYITPNCEGLRETGSPMTSVPFSFKGLDLQNTPLQARGKDPQGSGSWREVTISLAKYTRSRVFLNNPQRVQLHVVIENSGGNNLYLDDFRMETYRPSMPNDVGIEALHMPPVTCVEQTSTRFIARLRNYGNTEHLNQNLLLPSDNEGLRRRYAIAPGWTDYAAQPSEIVYFFVWKDLLEATGVQEVEIMSPDPAANTGTGDPANNVGKRGIYRTPSRVITALPAPSSYAPEARDQAQTWAFLNPQDISDTWDIQTMPNDEETFYPLRADFFQRPHRPERTAFYLISPHYTLPETEAPVLLSFRHAYAARAGHRDRLSLLVYKNCEPYVDTVLYDKAGMALSYGKTSQERWQPQEEDWTRELIDLSAYKGVEKVQFAFVATSDGGQDIFLDSIEVLQLEERSSPTLLLSPQNRRTVSHEASSIDIAVFSNTAWSVRQGNADWVSQLSDGTNTHASELQSSGRKTLTITYQENTDQEARETTIAFTATDVASPPSLGLRQASPPPRLSIVPQNTRTVSHEMGTIDIAVSSNTAWTVRQGNAGWVSQLSDGTNTDPSELQSSGSKTLTITYQENTDNDARETTIAFTATGIANPPSLDFRQASPSPRLSIVPQNRRTVSYEAGAIDVAVSSNTAWSVRQGNADWVRQLSDGTSTDPSELHSSGNKTLTITYQENTDNDARETTIAFTAIGIAIPPSLGLRQASPPPRLSIVPQNTRTVSHEMGTIDIAVSSNTAWMVRDGNADWVRQLSDGARTHASELQSQGNKTLTITYQENTDNDARETTIAFTATGLASPPSLEFRQASPSPRLVIMPQNMQTVTYEAGAIDVAVFSNTAWTVRQGNADWVRQLSDGTRTHASKLHSSGSKTLTITYQENTNQEARETTISFTAIGIAIPPSLGFRQTSPPPRLSIVPQNMQTVTHEMGTIDIAVSSNIAWTVRQGNADWVRQLSDGTSTHASELQSQGNKTLTITYQENTDNDARETTIAFTATGITSPPSLGLRQTSPPLLPLTGLQGPEHDLGIRLFPNPTEHRFFVETDQEASLRLLDAQGRVLSAWTIRAGVRHTIDLSRYAAGLYFVEAQTLEGVMLRRWVLR